ncbi:hypothetical protein VW29_15560 [Devosia limi DSM 17137]|uniref:Uncharacterized protein n=1 Tax=Devosia limi DSM 17137 TaxID=1121477 RepID=A0A0F5LM73_9HYPH|nr:hypothetical protein [Devosia limi]KKB82717.1 hypothetical protein VW29_15560 [Devosia limi DSM 17137]SHE40167.1 hypothetical protein SAMN02745223_00285 [Devosia limi DSM 17137]
MAQAILDETMLLFRSIFWLTIAYVVIKPGVDFHDAATALSGQAVAAGQQIVAEQVQTIECDTIQCIGGKAVLAAVLPTPPSAGTSPMHDAPAVLVVPYPMPRLGRAG